MGPIGATYAEAESGCSHPLASYASLGPDGNRALDEPTIQQFREEWPSAYVGDSYIGFYWGGVYWDNGKENGNYYLGFRG